MEYCYDRPDHVLLRVVEGFWNIRPEKTLSGFSVRAWKVQMLKAMQLMEN